MKIKLKAKINLLCENHLTLLARKSHKHHKEFGISKLPWYFSILSKIELKTRRRKVKMPVILCNYCGYISRKNNVKDCIINANRHEESCPERLAIKTADAVNAAIYEEAKLKNNSFEELPG